MFIRKYFLGNGNSTSVLYGVRNPNKRREKGMTLEIEDEKARPVEDMEGERIRKEVGERKKGEEDREKYMARVKFKMWS